MIFNKEKFMLRGLYRGTLDILYDSHNSARIKMNSHIRTFDEGTTAHTYIKQTVIGFWRMILEILLNVYLITSLLLLTSLVFCVVIVAWPLTFLAVTFTSMTENLYDERRFQQQVAAEAAALEASKQDPVMGDPVKETPKKK